MENAIRRLDTLEGLNECERTKIYVKLATSLNSHLLDLITSTNLRDDKLLVTLKCILYQDSLESGNVVWTQKLCCNLRDLKEQQQQLFIQQQQIQKAILDKLSQHEVQEIVTEEAEADESSEEDETGTSTPTASQIGSTIATASGDNTKMIENKFSTKKIVNCITVTLIILFIGFLGDYIPIVGKALSWLMSGYYLGWTLEQLTDVNSVWVVIISNLWKIDVFRHLSQNCNNYKQTVTAGTSRNNSNIIVNSNQKPD